MADVYTGVTYAHQETLFYCGPATAEMVLASLGVPSLTPPTWQDRLWDYIVANTGSTRPPSAPSSPTSPSFPRQKCERCAGLWNCWSTTPAVLQQLLNSSQAVAQYAVSKHSLESTATGVLLDTIDRQLPGIALVFGWQHWLVVDGYRHSEPGATPVAGRNLNGVYIRDPWASDAIGLIPWIDWQDDYLSVVPCGSFAGKIVVLGGARLAAPAPSVPHAPSGLRIVDGRAPEAMAVRMEMRDLLTPQDAVRRATEQVSSLRESRFRIALHLAEAKTARLVQRLDRDDDWYYIVTFEVTDHETARVMIDGFDGRLRQVAGISREGEALPPFVPAPAAMNRLMSDSDQGSEWLAFRVRPGTVGEHPVLVWKPCGQSSSPFLPFYQWSVGDSFVYYRVDGRMFDALTEGPA